MMLYVFGDLHLSAMNPWSYDVGEKFISWFNKWCSNLKDDEKYILWLGDITEQDVNPGDVIDQEFRIFKKCSETFIKTYVLMGNHDLKLYKQKAQHSLKFLRNIKNVHIIEQPEEFKVCNTKIRALPFMRIDGQSLVDYYSNMEFEDYVDLVVGHWNKDSKKEMFRGVDVSKMKTRMFCLGHIHTRIDKDYTGSIFPNKVNEVGERVYKVFQNGVLKYEERFPEFLKYDIIKYPNDTPTIIDDAVHVYEIEGVKSFQAAVQHYPGIYIKGVKNIKIDKEQITSYKSSDVFLYESNLQAYNDWLKETRYPVSRKTSVIINSLLK